jgi:hypothetical protein
MRPATHPLPGMSVVRFVLANMVDFFPEADLAGFPAGGA